MKIVKASGKTKLLMSKSEWQSMGKKAGWLKSAQNSDLPPDDDNDEFDVGNLGDDSRHIEAIRRPRQFNNDKPENSHAYFQGMIEGVVDMIRWDITRVRESPIKAPDYGSGRTYQINETQLTDIEKLLTRIKQITKESIWEPEAPKTEKF